MKIFKVIGFILVSAIVNIYASDTLSEQQIKDLFTNKTFDVLNTKKNKLLKGYDSADGTHLIYVPKKDKLSKRKWWTNGDRHCTSHPKRGDSCKSIVNMGDGVYYGYTDGKHTHTLSDFKEGNQLKN